VHKNGSLIPIHRVRVYPISDPFRIRVSQPSTYCKMNYVKGVFNKFLKYHAKILSRSSVSENTVFQDGILERQSAYSPQLLSDCNNTQHSQDSAVTRLRSGKWFASQRGEVLLQSDRKNLEVNPAFLCNGCWGFAPHGQKVTACNCRTPLVLML